MQLIEHRIRRLTDIDTGEYLETEQITKTVSQKAFWKLYLTDFLNILGILENRQIDALIYILEHTNPVNNTYIGTYRSTATNSGISLDTITRVMRKLQASHFITRVQNGVYTVNPKIMYRGDKYNARFMVEYTATKTENNNA